MNLWSHLKTVEGLPSQGRRNRQILKIVYFLEDYIGTDGWQRRYILGRYSYVNRTKQGRKTRALWGISYYHRMCNAIAEVWHKSKSL
jgi:hypothetical protein